MSNDTNLKIPLDKRIDSEGKSYFIAKVRGPFTIDCTNGICFLIFCSENGLEEMQVGPLLDKRDKK